MEPSGRPPLKGFSGALPDAILLSVKTVPAPPFKKMAMERKFQVSRASKLRLRGSSENATWHRGCNGPSHTLQHLASLAQVHAVVAARKPAVNRREQRARVIRPSDAPPYPRQTCRGSQFEQRRTLPSRRCQSFLKQRFHLRVRRALGRFCAGFYAKPFGVAVMLTGRLRLRRCLIQRNDGLLVSMVLHQYFRFADEEQWFPDPGLHPSENIRGALHPRQTGIQCACSGRGPTKKRLRETFPIENMVALHDLYEFFSE